MGEHSTLEPAKAPIFGREPAFWIGVIEAGLALFVSLVLKWSAEQVGAVMAVVTVAFSIYTAWVTTQTMLAGLVGLAKAVIALALAFGFDLPPDVAGSVLALVTIVAGGYNRASTEVAHTPAFTSPPKEPPADELPAAA